MSCSQAGEVMPLRYGPGLYFSATVSKSNDYVQPKTSRRAVLLCKVLQVGRPTLFIEHVLC